MCFHMESRPTERGNFWIVHTKCRDDVLIVLIVSCLLFSFRVKGGLQKNRFYYGLVRDARKWLKNYSMLFFFCHKYMYVTLGLPFLEPSSIFFGEKVWNSCNDLLEGCRDFGLGADKKQYNVLGDKTTTSLWQKNICRCALW